MCIGNAKDLPVIKSFGKFKSIRAKDTKLTTVHNSNVVTPYPKLFSCSNLANRHWNNSVSTTPATTPTFISRNYSLR